MDFVTKSFRKDETLTSWTLLKTNCPHFWAWLLLYSAITAKSEDKYVVKVFDSSEFHLSEMTLLQNWHFRSALDARAETREKFSLFFWKNWRCHNSWYCLTFNPLITCPPIFSDLPPALISSGFVGKKPCRRWFMPSVRGWSVQLCDFRDPIFAQGSTES